MKSSPEKSGQSDPAGKMDALGMGNFSSTEQERKEIIRKAEAEGKDPGPELAKLEAKMRAATARCRDTQGDQAVERLSRDLEG